MDIVGPKLHLMLFCVWFASFTLLISISLVVYQHDDMNILFPQEALRGLGVRIGHIRCSNATSLHRSIHGLYSMVGRFATIIGPLSWAIIVDELGLGPAAIGFLS